MMAMGTPAPKAKRYTCNRCGISAPEPIVKPVANPRFDGDGRCSNTQACDRRGDRAVRESRNAKRKGA